ncbi:hypothetical protein Fmac_008040 [Flemingia macrophylla]|uniref:Uncharacterized protein n=1 Tax=Flemingia macrophylla TaxID=520843 RepID=A0ABD1MYN8_9FABA
MRGRASVPSSAWHQAEIPLDLVPGRVLPQLRERPSLVHSLGLVLGRDPPRPRGRPIIARPRSRPSLVPSLGLVPGRDPLDLMCDMVPAVIHIVHMIWLRRNLIDFKGKDFSFGKDYICKNTHLALPHVADVTCMDPSVAEKLCKTVRLLGYDMHDIIIRRGKSIGKTLNDVVARHHQALTCRPRDAHVSFVSPLEYQFSCSGSPPRRRRLSPPSSQRGARMCRDGGGAVVERRVKMMSGSAPMLKQAEKEFQVDEAAEEFIARFYRELRLQKWLDHHYC